MVRDVLRWPLVLLCVASLTLGAFPQPGFSQTSETTGSMAGNVFEKNTRAALPGVNVIAQRITTNERFPGLATDERGSYLISPVPPGIYVFYLEYKGIEYTVDERFDIRTDMDFLMESCFQLDLTQQAAELIPDCKSGVYAETQVVSLGPHRLYRNSPDLIQETAAEDLEQTGLILTHAGVECIANDQYSMLHANIQPSDQVQSSRIYFRAIEHPDFYYVNMERTEDNFTGILPMPSPDTKQVIYYIEAVDDQFNMTQSQEWIPDVVDLDTCKRRDPGAAYFTGDNPGIVVGATVGGVAAVPAGFQAAGIAGFISAAGAVSTAAVAVGAAAGAGAGIGTVGTVLIVAGATAAAGGVVSGVTGGETDEPEASPVQ